MAEFPALPLFTDALMADCWHLTNAELGIYIKLLVLIWRSNGCKIPNDPEWVSRKLSCSPELVFPLVKEFCHCDGNFITQKRLFKEYERVKNISQKNSDIAKQRENNKKLQHARATTDLVCGAPPIPIPIEVSKKEKNDSKKRNDLFEFILPNWIPKEKWDAWMETCARKKNNKTDYAKNLAVGKLKKFRDAGLDIGSILDKAIFNSYTDLYAPDKPEIKNISQQVKTNVRTL